MKYKLANYYVQVLLVLLSACNYPISSRSPGSITNEQFRQTLAAGPPLNTLTPASDEPTPTIQDSFSGLSTATPSDQFQATVSPPADVDTDTTYIYYAQSGDTLPVLSTRFEVNPGEISSTKPVPDEAYIPPGQLLLIPKKIGEIPYPSAILPDSEVINSPTAAGFNIHDYIQNAGGYLSTYEENVYGDWLSGAEIIERVSLESSVSPRFLLAFLQHRSNWVLGFPEEPVDKDYPIGFHVSGKRGLYQEVVLVATQLNKGYYGWRLGDLSELKFPDNSVVHLSPELNAGSIATQYLFSKFYYPDRWEPALYGVGNFTDLYADMFGDPWLRAESVEPLFPVGLEQPALELPFQSGERWSMTGGPHYSWNAGSPRGALDFAPVTGEPQCEVSRAWVTASASGLVTRSVHNVLVIDLDGDGYEQTGWTIVYLHLADKDRLSAWNQVKIDDQLGHPSCERGNNTGTHVHIARKYNGEWLAADGPIPMILSGWEVHADERNYQGEMKNGSQTVRANPSGPGTSIIVR